MLTKNQKTGMTYFSRVVALPLVAITAFAFTVRTNERAGRDQSASLLPGSLLQVESRERTITQDTLPEKAKKISTVDVRKSSDKKVNKITIAYTDGTKETLTRQEAEQRGLLNAEEETTTSKSTSGKETITVRNNNANQPLFLLDGKEITKEEMEKIDPTTIESVNVLKDKSATGTYGEKGKNGVIEITLKKG